MAEVNGSKITVHKGDVAELTFYTNEPNGFAESAYVFGVKKTDQWNDDQAPYVIKKNFSVAAGVTEHTIELTATDTNIDPGEYAWGLRQLTGPRTKQAKALFVVEGRVVHDE